MSSCMKVITVKDFEKVVAGTMDYAIVRQSKVDSEKLNVFVCINGEAVTQSTSQAMT